MCACMCACICVCGFVRERESKRGKGNRGETGGQDREEGRELVWRSDGEGERKFRVGKGNSKQADMQ